jgi:hypothetical protein
MDHSPACLPKLESRFSTLFRLFNLGVEEILADMVTTTRECKERSSAALTVYFVTLEMKTIEGVLRTLAGRAGER